MQEMKNNQAQVEWRDGEPQSWVAPMTQDDRDFFVYFRKVFQRYNINPSKATRLEYDFVTRVAESEYYLQQVNA